MESNIEGFSWSRLDPLRDYEQWVRFGALASSAFRVAISENYDRKCSQPDGVTLCDVVAETRW